MPQSLILNLVTQSLIPQEHLQGYSLEQLFFHLVDIVDPELGRVLRRDKQNRAYSLSALQRQHPSSSLPPQSGSNVRLFTPKVSEQAAALQYSLSDGMPKETSCWWRISFLDDALFDHLIFLWNQLKDEIFPMGSGRIKIIHIAADLPGSDWASSQSYTEIYEQASAYERDIHLQFVTPTAFETQGSITSLPTVNAVFQPLRKCWNRYGGLAFAPSVLDLIVPAHFNIQTEMVQSIRRQSLQSIVGCTGKISFRIIGDDDPLIVKRINALANFTRYCPVGYNTRLGMGVVRRLYSQPLALYRPSMS